jgi:exonuclease III
MAKEKPLQAKIICGYLNICHKPNDIHKPVGNKNSSGFLPEEQEWLTRFIESGFIAEPLIKQGGAIFTMPWRKTWVGG